MVIPPIDNSSYNLSYKLPLAQEVRPREDTMNKILKIASVSIVALTSAASIAQAAEWRGWAIHPEDYPNTVAMQSFADQVAEVTEGRITPTVYANGIREKNASYSIICCHNFSSRYWIRFYP